MFIGITIAEVVFSFFLSLSRFLRSSDMRKSTGKCRIHCPKVSVAAATAPAAQLEKNYIQKKLSEFSSWGIRREWKNELVDVRESRNYTQRTEPANGPNERKIKCENNVAVTRYDSRAFIERRTSFIWLSLTLMPAPEVTSVCMCSMPDVYIQSRGTWNSTSTTVSLIRKSSFFLGTS